jgi:hypothetical protein
MKDLNIDGMIIGRGKPKFSERNLPTLVSLSTKNSTYITLGLNQGL